MFNFAVIVLPLFAFIIFLFVRIIFFSYKIRANRNPKLHSKRKTPVRTMIVLGSGGHTTELLRLVSSLSDNYTPRHYIIANTDAMSREKAEVMEKQRLVDGKKSEYTFSVIPRSREVKQSWISTVASTLYAFIRSISIFFKSDGRPDLLLCNGPGTCIPLCVVAILCKLMWIGKPVVIVYVESICRVETLSLSGRILYYLADQFVVQWPQLIQKYPLVTYLGKIF